MKIISLIKKLFIKKPKKLGLAIGSGGAKGMAALGVCKALEENGVSFDAFGGTSIGSILGGLLADNHTIDEIFSFIKQFDVTNPTTLVMMKLRGETAEKLLNKVMGGQTFENLKKPCFAVACDVNTGEEIVLEGGLVARAMAASSAIPPLFRPVAINNRKLIDGAFVNALPADLLKKRGADIVIGINLTDRKKNLNSLRVINKLYPGHKVKKADRLTKGLNACDLVFEPDLSGFTASSVDKLMEMYNRGYRAGIQLMPDLLKLLKKNRIKIKKGR